MSDDFGSQKGLETPPLIEAIEKGDFRRVRDLLDQGADPNLRYLHYFPLFAAMIQPHAIYTDLLLRNGAKVNAKELLQGWTALHNAAYWGHLLPATGLIIYRADLFLKTNHGYTALDLAKIHSRGKMVKFLEKFMRIRK